jgi:hypothetical protein
MRSPALHRDHDQRAQAHALRAIACSAHHRDDLLDARRIRRIPTTPVPWRPPRVEPRHRRRRSATPSSIQQHRLHHTLLGLNDNATIVPAAPHREQLSTTEKITAITRTDRR